MYAYMGGVIRELGGVLEAIGGMAVMWLLFDRPEGDASALGCDARSQAGVV